MYEISKQYLAHFPVLPFDRESAEIFADIASALQEKGERISSFDELIAAIAIRHEETLVTRGRHFTGIPGLTVQGY